MGLTEPIINRIAGEEGIPATTRVQVDIRWASIFRVLVGVLLAYAAILLWPMVAAYPVVERLRLAHKLAPDTVRAHEEQFP